MQKVSCWEKFKFCTASTALNVRYKCCAHESSNMMKYLMMFLYLWIKDYLRDGQSVHKKMSATTAFNEKSLNKYFNLKTKVFRSKK